MWWGHVQSRRVMMPLATTHLFSSVKSRIAFVIEENVRLKRDNEELRKLCRLHDWAIND